MRGCVEPDQDGRRCIPTPGMQALAAGHSVWPVNMQSTCTCRAQCCMHCALTDVRAGMAAALLRAQPIGAWAADMCTACLQLTRLMPVTSRGLQVPPKKITAAAWAVRVPARAVPHGLHRKASHGRRELGILQGTSGDNTIGCAVFVGWRVRPAAHAARNGHGGRRKELARAQGHHDEDGDQAQVRHPAV